MGSHTASTKIFDSESYHTFPLTFPTLFTDKHFLLIKKPISETVSSELFILLHFLHPFLALSFKNRTFSQNHTLLSLYFKRFSRGGIFIHSKNLPITTFKNTNKTLQFSSLICTNSCPKHLLEEIMFR